VDPREPEVLGDYLNQPKTPLINAATNWLRYEIIGGAERVNPKNWPLYQAGTNDIGSWVTQKVMPPKIAEMVDAGVAMQMPTEAHLGIAQEMNEVTAAALNSGKWREFGQKWMRIITGSPLGQSRTGRLAGGAVLVLFQFTRRPIGFQVSENRRGQAKISLGAAFLAVLA